MLEKRRDELLDELKKLHSVRESEIMELFHSIEKTGNRMGDACKFASRLVELGNAAEILTLKKVVGTQLMNLINNTPKPDVNVTLEFSTNLDNFSDAVKVNKNYKFRAVFSENIFNCKEINFASESFV